MTLLSAERKSLDSSPLSDTAPATASALAPGGPAPSPGAEDPELRMMEKREKVVEELLQTEKDYIKDLQMCVSEIVEPLQRKQVGGGVWLGGGVGGVMGGAGLEGGVVGVGLEGRVLFVGWCWLGRRVLVVGRF